MTELSHLQDALAGEHAAVYLYAVLGARTSTSAEPTLSAAIDAAYVEHRARRDDLVGLLAATGTTPSAAAAAYRFPEATALDSPTAVTAAATALEAACSATYANVVGFTTATTREQAVRWLQMTAIRELTFRGTPEMFPGAGEYADH